MSPLPKRFLPPLLFALGLAVAGTVLLASPAGRHLEEDFGLALLFKLRGPIEPPADLVIVNVDEQSAEAFGMPTEPYKWQRDVYADLVDRLSGFGAAVIVFDMHFADDKDPEADRRFAAAVRRAGNVILVQRLLRKEVGPGDGSRPVELEQLISPIAPLAGAALAMAPFPLPKVPVRVNQAWTFKSSFGDIDIPTLPVVALQALAISRSEACLRCLEELASGGAPGRPGPVEQSRGERGLVETMQRLRSALKGGGAAPGETDSPSCRALPAADRQLVQALFGIYRGGNNVHVNFFGPPGTLETRSLHTVVDVSGDERALAARIRGRVVFVGAARTFWSEQKDGFFTVFTRADGLDLSGVEIAATVYANLRDRSQLRPLPFAASAAILLAAATLACLICFLATPTVAAGGLFVFIAGGLLMGRAVFAAHHLWPPVIVPLAAVPAGAYLSAVLYKYIGVRRERRHMERALRLYLPDAVVEQISADLSFITSGDRMIYGACLLSDAANYTTLSERLEPGVLSTLMKDYFQIMFKVVNDCGGTVTNMIGDTMFAVWPSTEPQVDLKAKACQAAQGILAALDTFNGERPDMALPTRLGLHSGYLLMGNIGAEGHFEYAPVGDIVNTASRIEGLNKRLGTWLLASEETVAGCDGLTTRLMGTFLLSGKSRPVTIYQLLPEEAAGPAADRVRGELFPEALALFRQRQWQPAIAVLNRCLELQSDDGPSRFYLDLCRTYRRKPPATGWQGVIAVGK